MPLEPGRVRLATERTWQHPRAVLGEVSGGRWRSLEVLPVSVRAGGVTLDFEALQALNLALVREQERLPTATAGIMQTLCNLKSPNRSLTLPATTAAGPSECAGGFQPRPAPPTGARQLPHR